MLKELAISVVRGRRAPLAPAREERLVSPPPSARLESADGLELGPLALTHAGADAPLGLQLHPATPPALAAALRRPRYDVAETLEALSALPTPRTWGTRTLGRELAKTVPPGNTLGRHSQEVAQAYERYFDFEPQVGLSRDAYRLLALLHDAGKHASLRFRRTTKAQHRFTERYLDFARAQLPLGEPAFQRMKVLLRTDPLGPYLREDAKQAGLRETADAIVRSAQQAGMTPSGYLRALVPYYQADMLAYTAEGAGRAGSVFDRHFARDASGSGRRFAFDWAERRLSFAPPLEARFVALQRELASLA